MGNPYLGEIRMFGGNFAPAGWMFCDGALLPISENDVLFNLIGTTYGGDGQNTFGLPDLRGRVPLHQGQQSGGQNYQIGQLGGVETVTITAQTTPIHNHALIASTAASSNPSPNGNILATSATISPYVLDIAGPALAANAVSNTGGSQPHDNMMPFLCINFILALNGIYPSQT